MQPLPWPGRGLISLCTTYARVAANAATRCLQLRDSKHAWAQCNLSCSYSGLPGHLPTSAVQDASSNVAIGCIQLYLKSVFGTDSPGSMILPACITLEVLFVQCHACCSSSPVPFLLLISLPCACMSCIPQCHLFFGPSACPEMGFV